MSRRLHAPLADWTSDDVLALIEQQVEEGQRLEYKSELELEKPRQRRESAKDASGLGNAQGGLLIYGVAEEAQEDGRRLPVSPSPLAAGDAQSRLEDVLDSTVTPRLNFQMRQLETEGGYFLVVRVFPRVGVPHMVDAYDDKRCYIRVGLKTRPMEQHELTAAYAQAAGLEQQATKRLAPLPLIARPEGVQLQRRADNVAEGPWLAILALPIDAPDPLLVMNRADRLAFPDDGEYGRWYRESSLSPSLSWDGLGYKDESPDQDGPATLRLRLFRNGVFEWARSMARYADTLPSIAISQIVHDVLGYFATSYRRAGYFGRVRIWVSLEAASDTLLEVGPDFGFHTPQPLNVAHLEWRGDESVEGMLHSLTEISRAVADRMWVAYGFSGCPYFDESGQPLDKLLQ